MCYNTNASSGRELPLFILFERVIDMEEKLKVLIDEKIKHMDMHVDSIKLEKEGSETFLRIALDADFMIDLAKVVMATRIISPILDKEDLIKEEYMLDVYAKSKGDVESE